jgi:hypothetical protein
MFNDSGDQWLRKYEQEDLLAAGIRVALSALGPFGAVIAELATHCVPKQRLDRLQDFIERLNEQLAGMQTLVRERIQTSAAYAALAEEASLAAVRTASDERRRDLASLLRTGLQLPDGQLIEQQALLRLLEALNEPQILILMSYGNFDRTLHDPPLEEFYRRHPGVFSVQPPTYGSSPEEQRRWAMFRHYEDELMARGLLRNTEGIAKSGRTPRLAITNLGRLLLEAVDRAATPTT